MKYHDYPLRLLLAFLAGIVVSGFLSWMMFLLVQSGNQQLEDSRRTYMLDFIRVKRDEVSQKKEKKPQRKLDEAPETPQLSDMEQSSDSSNNIAIGDYYDNTNIAMNMDNLSIGVGDGNFLPIVKVLPVYPYKALHSGIEGNCTVAYTVTTLGSTQDIRVIDDRCDHRSFRKPSIDAAKKFKYKPKIINGEAVEVQNVLNTFIFKIQPE